MLKQLGEQQKQIEMLTAKLNNNFMDSTNKSNPVNISDLINNSSVLKK